MKKSSKTKRGFTLIELLVTISILSILAGITVTGYLGFIKKAKIAADEMLASQVNTIISGYLFNSDDNLENSIAKAIQPHIEKDAEIKSHEFDMDIFFNSSIGKFELMGINEGTSNNYKTLHYYLNLIIPVKNFTVKQEITEKSISITYNDDEIKIVPSTLNLSDYIDYTSNEVSLFYTIETISKVVYQGSESNSLDTTNLVNISESINFEYPGKFKVTITDGNYSEHIIIKVYNEKCNDAKLSDNTKDIPQDGLHTQINQDKQQLFIPILQLFKISDYDNYENIEDAPTINVPAWDFIKNYTNDRNIIGDDNRLIIKINGKVMEIIEYENTFGVFLNDYIGDFIFEYYYQGLNGKWVPHRQKINIKMDDNDYTAIITLLPLEE